MTCSGPVPAPSGRARLVPRRSAAGAASRSSRPSSRRGRRGPARPGGDAGDRGHARALRRPRAARARVPQWRERDEPRGPVLCGASPGSSCAPVACELAASTPLAHTTSRSSTASRCRRTTSPSPSLRSTGASSTRRARTRSAPGARGGAVRPPPSPAHRGHRARRALERRQRRGLRVARRRTGSRCGSVGASRVSAGGHPTAPSCCSSKASSTRRPVSSTPWRRMRCASGANGCSRT